MRFVELHKAPRVEHSMADDLSDDLGEPGSMPQATAPTGGELVTIQVDSIRCFYARRADRGPGTRITFKDGGGFAVSESYEEVSAMVQTH